MSRQHSLVKMIRHQYPTPAKFDDTGGGSGDYCVGGALFLYCLENNQMIRAFIQSQIDWHECLLNFPLLEELTVLLRELNPDLTAVMAESYADGIMSFNDIGQFEHAYKRLEEALEHRSHLRKKPRPALAG